MLTRLVKIIIPRDGYSIRTTKGVPKVTFSFSYTQRVGFGSRAWLIPTLCEIRRIAVLKFHDTDPYSSRIQTYPDVPCSKTCDGLNPISGYVIETRRMETRKFPYTFRFAANNGVPYTSARSVKLCLSKKLSFPPCEQFHSAFLSRNSTVLDESICILEPDFPRHNENRVVFKNPKFHGSRRIGLCSRTWFSYQNGWIFENPKFLGTWRIDSYSRFWYSTVREISLGILDPHYILSGVLGKSNEFSR